MGNLMSCISTSISVTTKKKGGKISFIRKCFIKSANTTTLEHYSQLSGITLKQQLLESNDYEITPISLPRYNYEVVTTKVDTPIKSMHDIETHSVVLISPTYLRAMNSEHTHLPLGTILDVLFHAENWLYVRTAHKEEGYVSSDVCLPLQASFLLNYQFDYEDIFEPLKLIYEKDFGNHNINYSERNVDILYLQANGIKKQKQKLSNEHISCNCNTEIRDKKVTILIIKNDYFGHELNTLSVKKGDTVYLVHNRVSGWYWVRNEGHMEGFIPASIAGYTCY